MRKYWQYLLTPEGEPIAADYFQSSMPGNSGYLIKPHSAKILVEEYKNSFLPADNAINQHLVKIQIHSYMMGKAEDRNPTAGKSSLIRTHFWDKNERNI
jgi:GR25 family glycosyltransferase involved in LPS biosynthesis